MSDWRQEGSCQGAADPDLWFSEPPPAPEGRSPEQSPRVLAAQAICSGCLVQVTCLDWAMETGEPHGIWGGLTTEDRQDLGLEPDHTAAARAAAEAAAADRRHRKRAEQVWRESLGILRGVPKRPRDSQQRVAQEAVGAA